MSEEARPSSATGGARGRVTRRAAPAALTDDVGAGGSQTQDDDEGSVWKAEMESIMNGTYPPLAEALAPHEQQLKRLVGQADRVRQLQLANIDALYACEKKQADDEHVAQLQFFKSRLIDGIEEKQKHAGSSGRKGGKVEKGKGSVVKRMRVVAGTGALPSSFVLKPEELKADLDEINTSLDHYSVRSAAVVSEELRSGSSHDAWLDRSRQLLHCNGHSFERGAVLYVYMQGQRVDDSWTLTAMNAVEVTLRDVDGTKLKVTLAQLRNGRYAFRSGGGM